MRTDMFQQALEDLNGSTADIEATNGVIHVIDSVILPPM